MNYEIGDQTKCAICGSDIILYLSEDGEAWEHKYKKDHDAIPYEDVEKLFMKFRNLVLRRNLI